MYATPRKREASALSPEDFNKVMKANKAFAKKLLGAGTILVAFSASNRAELGRVRETLPRVDKFGSMLWMEYPEFEEALCRCALMKATATGSSKDPTDQVLKLLGDMCRNTSKLKSK